MKKLSFLVLFIAFHLIVNAQAKRTSYLYNAYTINSDGQKENHPALNNSQKNMGILVNADMPYNHLYIISADTLYAEKTYKNITYPYDCIVQTNDVSYSYNAQTGTKFRYYSRRRDFPEGQYKKTQKKVSDLKGKKYECYKAENNFIQSYIWIEKNGETVEGDQFFYGLSFNNNLILRQETYFKKSKKTRIRNFVEIQTTNVPTCSGKIKWVENRNDDTRMYSSLPENQSFELSPIKVGETAPNLFFKKLNFEKSSLQSFKGNGKFTLVEFWGTWCGPCLAATPKLKTLYKSHKDKLDIISINSKDHRSSYVKQLIDLKQINWNHAYASKEFLTILNPLDRFPTMILLDDNMKVLFIGNPNGDMDKVIDLIK